MRKGNMHNKEVEKGAMWRKLKQQFKIDLEENLMKKRFLIK